MKNYLLKIIYVIILLLISSTQTQANLRVKKIGRRPFLINQLTKKITILDDQKDLPGELVIQSWGFRNFPPLVNHNFMGLHHDPVKSLTEPEPAIIGNVLNYPNPAPLHGNTTIGFTLSKRMDIDIYIYDMFANLVHKEVLLGLEGNVFTQIKLVNLERIVTTTGVYFYFIVYKGKILGKSKMAIIP